MDDCISLRINRIITELFNGNKSEFARIIGVSESAVRSYLANTLPKADVLEKIAKNIAISCEWLVMGSGDMLVVPNQEAPLCNSTLDDRLLIVIKEKDAKIEEQAKQIGRLEAENEMLKAENKILKKDARTTDAGGATSVAAAR